MNFPAELDEQVLDPTTSVHRISRQVGVSQTTAWRILKRKDLYIYIISVRVKDCLRGTIILVLFILLGSYASYGKTLIS